MARNRNDPQIRETALQLREVKEEERRITVSFSSEQPVERWYGNEILCHDADCVDLTRLTEIGVSLFNHERDMVIGKIENPHVDETEKRAYCDIVFDDDEESEKIYQKVLSGTLKGVSVGYRVKNWEEVGINSTSANGRFTGPADIAIKWEPYEVSIVSVPADSSVGVGRELEEPKQTEKREITMGEEQTKETAIDVEEQRQEAVKQERQRTNEIMTMCRDFNIDSTKYIEEGKSVEDVRGLILQQLKEKGKPMEVQVVREEAEKFRSAATDSILLRAGLKVEKEAEGARELRGMKLRDLAVDCVSRASGDYNAHRLSDDELFRRALSPDSAFASIVSDAVNKSMATAYAATPTTFQAWTGKGTMSDFKGAKTYQISEAGDLEQMTQTGEFKFDEMKDVGVTRSIATFGKAFGLTRQALINDDLDILTKIPQAYVRAAGRGINKLVYKQLADNPTIYDGNSLFDATNHKNYNDTGVAITVASLGAAKAAMRKQTNLRGVEKLNIQPRYLIVSPDKELEALQIVNSVYDPAKSNSITNNPFYNSLIVVVDAELNASDWYLAADPADIDTIEVSYLNGDEMPKLESQVAFDYLGIKFRIYTDYGVNVLDYRGLYKQKGN